MEKWVSYCLVYRKGLVSLAILEESEQQKAHLRTRRDKPIPCLFHVYLPLLLLQRLSSSVISLEASLDVSQAVSWTSVNAATSVSVREDVVQDSR